MRHDNLFLFENFVFMFSFVNVLFLIFRTYKLRPATTLLSMSQRFAAIRKLYPLGTLNINHDVPTPNPDACVTSYAEYIDDDHSGPHAQYKPDVFVPLMNQRPAATLQEGSAQNRFILQRLQEAMGRAAQPFAKRTITSSLTKQLSSSTGISMSSRTTENNRRSISSGVRSYDEPTSSTKGSERSFRKASESIKKTIRGSPRKTEHLSRRTEPIPRRTESTPRRNEPSSHRNEPSSRSREVVHPSRSSRYDSNNPPRDRKINKSDEPKKKSLSERLGRISVFNRLGSPTKKPIHERLSYTSDTTKVSIIDRLEKPRSVPTIDSPRFKARRRERRRGSRGGRSSEKPSLRRRFSKEDLNDDLDNYMAPD